MFSKDYPVPELVRFSQEACKAACNADKGEKEHFPEEIVLPKCLLARAYLIPELPQLIEGDSLIEEWEDWSNLFLLKYGEIFKGEGFQLILFSKLPKDLVCAVKMRVEETKRLVLNNECFIELVGSILFDVYDVKLRSLNEMKTWRISPEGDIYTQVFRLENLVKRVFSNVSAESLQRFTRLHLQSWAQENLPTLVALKVKQCSSYVEAREFLLNYLVLERERKSHFDKLHTTRKKFRGKCSKCFEWGHRRKECANMSSRGQPDSQNSTIIQLEKGKNRVLSNNSKEEAYIAKSGILRKRSQDSELKEYGYRERVFQNVSTPTRRGREGYRHTIRRAKWKTTGCSQLTVKSCGSKDKGSSRHELSVLKSNGNPVRPGHMSVLGMERNVEDEWRSKQKKNRKKKNKLKY